MPSYTLNYSLPYPIQTDAVDVASDIQSLASEVDQVLANKASTASPVFTGIPEAPTASSDTDTTQIATTEFVINQGYLKISNAASIYATIDSPAITGIPTAPTAIIGTNSTQIATTEFVTTAINNIDALPLQATNGGKFLTTDGSTASWQQIATTDVDGLDTVISNLSTTYAPLNLLFNSQTASYQLVLTDAAKQVEINSASANTLTIPNDTAANFPIGTTILVLQSGSGQTTIAGASGVTVNGTPGLKLRTQWSVATLVKRGVNLWLASGDVVS